MVKPFTRMERLMRVILLMVRDRDRVLTGIRMDISMKEVLSKI